MNITLSPDRTEANVTTVSPAPVDNLPLIIGVSVGAGVALLLVIAVIVGIVIARSATTTAAPAECLPRLSQ